MLLSTLDKSDIGRFHCVEKFFGRRSLPGVDGFTPGGFGISVAKLSAFGMRLRLGRAEATENRGLILGLGFFLPSF